MSILLISITLASIFSSNQEERFPVSVGFLALKETSSLSDKVTPLDNWWIASIETTDESILCIWYHCDFLQVHLLKIDVKHHQGNLDHFDV